MQIQIPDITGMVSGNNIRTSWIVLYIAYHCRVGQMDKINIFLGAFPTIAQYTEQHSHSSSMVL
jgi:hypothetical protein